MSPIIWTEAIDRHGLLFLSVIPAKAGIQCLIRIYKGGFTDWTPAFAGVTVV